MLEKCFFVATWSSAFTVSSPSLSLISVFLLCFRIPQKLAENFGRPGSCSPDLNFEKIQMCLRHSRDLQQESAVWIWHISLLFHFPHCLLQLFVELPKWIFKVSLFAGKCFKSPQGCRIWLLVSLVGLLSCLSFLVYTPNGERDH